MTRTIEQILGLTPMNQFDLVASPMTTAFVKGKPPKSNFEPWSHVPNVIPLDDGVAVAAKTSATTTASNGPAGSRVEVLKAAWLRKKREIFAGKLTKPDAEDPNIVNHLNWYQATGFTRPYPGEKKVLHPSELQISSTPPSADLD
jgi:hypothetical protein